MSDGLFSDLFHGFVPAKKGHERRVDLINEVAEDSAVNLDELLERINEQLSAKDDDHPVSDEEKALYRNFIFPQLQAACQLLRIGALNFRDSFETRREHVNSWLRSISQQQQEQRQNEPNDIDEEAIAKKVFEKLEAQAKAKVQKKNPPQPESSKGADA